MRKNKNNLYYFKLSQQKQEGILDNFYIFDERHHGLNKYIKSTKEIKNILITIKTLQNKKENKKIIEKYFIELSKKLNKFSNCSEFSCFINACDSILKSAKNNLALLKIITQKYFNKRILNESVPEQWIQAIIDSNSSRKKGYCGENKLLHILSTNNFREVKNWDEFLANKKTVAKFSKIFNTKDVRKKLNIKLSTKKQNKKLDLLIKSGKKIFLCEAKHLNTSGGGQDKQISELIEIINLKEKNKNIFYIAFLDGSYSNILLNDNIGSGKVNIQREEIKKYLLQNPNNFWVNTAGFKYLISHIK